MIALLSILTALLVLWHERRHPSIASDHNALGIFSALAAIAGAIGSAVGEAAGAVGSAVGSAAGTVGSALGIGGGAAGAGAGGLGSLASGGVGVGSAAGGPLEAVGGPASMAAGGTGVGLASGGSAVPASLGGSGMAAPSGGSPLIDKIQQLMKQRQGQQQKDRGGSSTPPFSPPALHIQPGQPFQVPAPVQTPGLANLIASIQARRQRLAALGLGGGLGGGGQ